jgi:hypothetical protein
LVGSIQEVNHERVVTRERREEEVEPRISRIDTNQGRRKRSARRKHEQLFLHFIRVDS